MIIIRLESIILPYKKQPRKYDCDTQCMICRELPNETVICPRTGRLRKSTNLLIFILQLWQVFWKKRKKESWQH